MAPLVFPEIDTWMGSSTTELPTTSRDVSLPTSNTTDIQEMAASILMEVANTTMQSMSAHDLDALENRNARLRRQATSYAFLITMLSVAVIMATMFTLFGLFVKASAHTFEHVEGRGNVNFFGDPFSNSNASLLAGRNNECTFFSDDFGDFGAGL